MVVRAPVGLATQWSWVSSIPAAALAVGWLNLVASVGQEISIPAKVR